MLDSLTLTNFKIHRSLKIPLSPFTVLVGPSGCGKSTVLEALWWLARRTDHNTTPTLDVCTKTSGRVTLEGRGVMNGASYIAEWCADYAGMDQFRLAFTDGTEPERGRYNELVDPRLAGELGGAAWRRFDMRSLVKLSRFQGGQPILNDEGVGLANLLAEIRLPEPEVFDAMVHGLRSVVPSVRGLRFDTVEERIPPHAFERGLPPVYAAMTRILVDTDQARGIPAQHVGEGTVLVLGLLATLYDLNRPRLVLLEDVGRNLDPQAQAALVGLLREVSQAREDLQIVCTTHAPMIVAGCAPEEVVRLEFDAAGRTVLGERRGNPRQMTPSEIVADYFGVTETGTSAQLQRYALLAGNPRRSLDEEQEVEQLRGRLVAAGAAPGFSPVERDAG